MTFALRALSQFAPHLLIDPLGLVEHAAQSELLQSLLMAGLAHPLAKPTWMSKGKT